MGPEIVCRKKCFAGRKVLLEAISARKVFGAAAALVSFGTVHSAVAFDSSCGAAHGCDSVRVFGR